MLSASVFITVKWSIKDRASQGCHKDEVRYFTRALSFVAAISLMLEKNIVVVFSSLFSSSASPLLLLIVLHDGTFRSRAGRLSLGYAGPPS